MAFGMSPFPLQFGTRGGGAASGPVNIAPPVLSGTEEVGEDLSVTTGGWTGTGTITYAYQWYEAIRVDDEVVYSGGYPTGVAIEGEDSATYTLVEDDEEEFFFCIVTATDDNGSTSAYSNVSGQIAEPFVDYGLTSTGAGARYGAAGKQADMEPSGDFTVAIRYERIADNSLFPYSIAGNNNNFQYLWGITSSGTNAVARLIIGGSTYDASVSAPAGGTYDIALRREGTELRIYKDGVFSAATTCPTTAITEATMAIFLAAYNIAGPNGRFAGTIHKLAYWDDAASIAELDAWFASNDVTTSSPSHAWGLDEGTGATAADAVGSADFALTGLTWTAL